MLHISLPLTVAVHAKDTPDEWIELYYIGKEPKHQYSKSDRQSSIRGEFDLLRILSVEWFTYIKMFYHLVYYIDEEENCPF